ncbi:MAG: YidB family protein [Pseudolabrys sp.]
MARALEAGMGLWDQLSPSLKAALGSVVATEGPALISAFLAKTNLGDLQGVVNQLQQSGLGDQVKSWLGNGPNMKVTPEQIRAALGNQQVRQIAQQYGVPVDEVLKLLADHLPTAVDQASPNGKI